MTLSSTKLSPFLMSLLLAVTILALSGTASAQLGADNEPVQQKQRGSFGNGDDDTEPCKKTGDRIYDEMIVKQCIKNQQKEYKELLSNGEEAAKLSTELEQSFEKSPDLTAADQKKLDRVEKLLKKIRSSLGANSDDEALPGDDKPLTVKAAFSALSESATGLLAELKKTTRYSVSVVAIQSSNAVIRLVKFIRFGKK